MVLLVLIKHNFVQKRLQHELFVVRQHPCHLHDVGGDAEDFNFVHFFLQLIYSVVALVNKFIFLFAVDFKVIRQIVIIFFDEVVVALDKGFEQVIGHVHHCGVLLGALRVCNLKTEPEGNDCVVAGVSVYLSVGIAGHLDIVISII